MPESAPTRGSAKGGVPCADSEVFEPRESRGGDSELCDSAEGTFGDVDSDGLRPGDWRDPEVLPAARPYCGATAAFVLLPLMGGSFPPKFPFPARQVAARILGHVPKLFNLHDSHTNASSERPRLLRSPMHKVR